MSGIMEKNYKLQTQKNQERKALLLAEVEKLVHH